MRWGVLLGKRSKDFIDGGLPNIHQHICISKPLHRPNLVALQSRRYTVQGFAAIILLQNLSVCDRSNSIVVKFEPSRFAVRFDESEVMAAMYISGMNQNSVQFVEPWFGPVGIGI